MNDAEQFAAQRRALLSEIRRLKREVQILSGQLGMEWGASLAKADQITEDLAIRKARLDLAHERLAVFDKDLGNN